MVLRSTSLCSAAGDLLRLFSNLHEKNRIRLKQFPLQIAAEHQSANQCKALIVIVHSAITNPIQHRSNQYFIPTSCSKRIIEFIRIGCHFNHFHYQSKYFNWNKCLSLLLLSVLLFAYYVQNQ